MTAVLNNMEKLFFYIGFGLYTLATGLYLGYAFTKRENLAGVGRAALRGAVLLHFISLLIRTYVGRHLPDHGWYVPWSNWFESFSFFSFVIAAEFLIIQSRQQLPILGAFVVPVLFGALVAAVCSPFGTQIPMIPPALQSFWLAIHVPVMFISYAAFANAFAVGLVYLIQERQIKSKKPSHLAFRLPPLDELDGLIYKIVAYAWPILVLGIILGARWAHDAWGRYWGWDAKETWAFITLLVYAL